MDLIAMIEEHARRASQAGEQPSQPIPAPTPAADNPIVEDEEPEWEEIEDVEVAAEATKKDGSPSEKPETPKEVPLAQKIEVVQPTSDDGDVPVNVEKEAPAADAEEENAKKARETEELYLKAEAIMQDANAKARAAEEWMRAVDERMIAADERMMAADEKYELAEKRLRELDLLEGGGEGHATLSDLKMKEVDGKMRQADEKMKQVDEKMKQADEKMRQVDEKLAAMWR